LFTPSLGVKSKQLLEELAAGCDGFSCFDTSGTAVQDIVVAGMISELMA